MDISEEQKRRHHEATKEAIAKVTEVMWKADAALQDGDIEAWSNLRFESVSLFLFSVDPRHEVTCEINIAMQKVKS